MVLRLGMAVLAKIGNLESFREHLCAFAHLSNGRMVRPRRLATTAARRHREMRKCEMRNFELWKVVRRMRSGRRQSRLSHAICRLPPVVASPPTPNTVELVKRVMLAQPLPSLQVKCIHTFTLLRRPDEKRFASPLGQTGGDDVDER
jgi:hypothetical protein